MAMTRWLLDTRPLWQHEDEVRSLPEESLIEAPLVSVFSCQGGATTHTVETSIRRSQASSCVSLAPKTLHFLLHWSQMGLNTHSAHNDRQTSFRGVTL